MSFTSFLQYLYPQQTFTAMIGWLARIQSPWLKNWMIQKFITTYQVDMTQAIEAHPQDYPDFYHFFTRELKAGARLICSGKSWCAPCDGNLSCFGSIDQGSLLQAKGREYTLLELLAGDKELAAQFQGGNYATIYLSPRDYHRIHMPWEGRLQQMQHVPGQLFSVSLQTAQTIPALFAKNERVINIFSTTQGCFAVILVGAIGVGSVETVWSGVVTPPHRTRGKVTVTDYSDREIILQKGAEMGRFNMGSTVILLTSPQLLTLNSALSWQQSIKMGESIGNGETVDIMV